MPIALPPWHLQQEAAWSLHKGCSCLKGTPAKLLVVLCRRHYMALRHGDTLHVRRPCQGIWRTLHQVGITRLTMHDFGSWG